MKQLLRIYSKKLSIFVGELYYVPELTYPTEPTGLHIQKAYISLGASSTIVI